MQALDSCLAGLHEETTSNQAGTSTLRGISAIFQRYFAFFRRIRYRRTTPEMNAIIASMFSWLT